MIPYKLLMVRDISRAAAIVVVACRKGEELTFQYRQESNRNDIALLHHFFLNERRPARLCAYDLPRALQKADAQESFTDADYAPGGRLCTLVRLPGLDDMRNLSHERQQLCLAATELLSEHEISCMRSVRWL